jgi:hypothetical protein
VQRVYEMGGVDTPRSNMPIGRYEVSREKETDGTLYTISGLKK